MLSETGQTAIADGTPASSLCPRCREPKLPHAACAKCGYKKGRPKDTKKVGYLAPTPDELDIFFREVRKAKDHRLDLAFTLTYYLGLRVRELASLRLADFVEVSGVGLIVSVQGLKGGWKRDYDISDPRITGKIRRWILRQRRPLKPSNPYLFPSEDPVRCDQPLSRDFFQDAFKHYAARAGLSPAHSIHSLRHACAFNLLMKGIPAPVIQRWLRLRCLETVQEYFARAEFAQVDAKVPELFARYL